MNEIMWIHRMFWCVWHGHGTFHSVINDLFNIHKHFPLGISTAAIVICSIYVFSYYTEVASHAQPEYRTSLQCEFNVGLSSVSGSTVLQQTTNMFPPFYLHPPHLAATALPSLMTGLIHPYPLHKAWTPSRGVPTTNNINVSAASFMFPPHGALSSHSSRGLPGRYNMVAWPVFRNVVWNAVFIERGMLVYVSTHPCRGIQLDNNSLNIVRHIVGTYTRSKLTEMFRRESLYIYLRMFTLLKNCEHHGTMWAIMQSRGCTLVPCKHQSHT